MAVLHSTSKVQSSTLVYLEPFAGNDSSLKHTTPTFKYREIHLQVPHSQHLLAAHQLVSIFQVHRSWRVFPDLPATDPNRNDRHQIHQGWCYKNTNIIIIIFKGTEFGYPSVFPSAVFAEDSQYCCLWTLHAFYAHHFKLDYLKYLLFSTPFKNTKQKTTEPEDFEENESILAWNDSIVPAYLSAKAVDHL